MVSDPLAELQQNPGGIKGLTGSEAAHWLLEHGLADVFDQGVGVDPYLLKNIWKRVTLRVAILVRFFLAEGLSTVTSAAECFF